IWHLSFEDGLTGAAVGNNASDLEGCFDLSNPITVTRIEGFTDGGELATDDPTEICAGDGVADPIFVSLTGAVGSNSAWVITDDLGNILDLPAGPPFDLDGAGPGVCLIWHLSFEDGLVGAAVGNNAADLQGCFDLSNPITVTRTGVEGGTITTDDPTIICAGDGQADPINVTLENAIGTNSAWVITDDQGNILDLPAGPPFDFEGAGSGVCLIWHLSFEDGLMGAAVGNNASDLEGCFSLSNSIAVIRNGVNGGEISTDDPTEICAGDGIADPIDVTLTGEEGTNSAWVITDDQGNILDLPAGPPFDLEGAGGGTCLIWHLSFEDGLMGAAVGNNATDLDGCFDLSNPIAVVRNGVAGGEITTMDPTEICAGDGVADPIDVTLTGQEGMNSAWVITDDQGNILELPAGPPFDFEGAGSGICLIWHLSFEDGLMGAAVGNNASDLVGCFSLSNPITVTRNGVAGGEISTTDPTEICAGDGIGDPIDVALTGQEGTNSAWVITDDLGNILELPAGPPFDLDGAGPGVCLIWHLSFEDGLMGAAVGNNASDLDGCFSLSNSIAVTRTDVDGGEVSTVDGETAITVCTGDEIADVIAFQTTSMDANYQYVVTDDNNIILGLPGDNMVDFEDAGVGVCRLWGLAYTGNITAAVGDDAAAVALTDECFELSSNFVEVTRTDSEEPCILSVFGVDALDATVNLFPNPASDVLTVDVRFAQNVRGNVQLEIQNTLGQVVYRMERPSQEAWTEQIEVGDLTAGMYILNLRQDGQVQSLRFTKQ
ncbi:MAG: T9SS type A sorting domain-containing protein, partial [Bacteroidota bacterium]